jgi:hypothetical protein
MTGRDSFVPSSITLVENADYEPSAPIENFGQGPTR